MAQNYADFKSSEEKALWFKVTEKVLHLLSLSRNATKVYYDEIEEMNGTFVIESEVESVLYYDNVKIASLQNAGDHDLYIYNEQMEDDQELENLKRVDSILNKMKLEEFRYSIMEEVRE